MTKSERIAFHRGVLVGLEELHQRGAGVMHGEIVRAVGVENLAAALESDDVAADYGGLRKYGYITSRGRLRLAAKKAS